jgi:V/A-type H+-transporting ATPase subunit C
MLRSEHAYLNTRLALFSGWMSRPELPSNLIRSDKSQFETLLQQACLPSDMAGLVSQPATLDRRLHQLLLEEVTLLLRATSGALHEFVVYWLRQYEIMNIKAVIRARIYGEAEDSEHIELLDLGRFSLLSIETLLAAEDVNEVLRILEHYGYRGLAQKARRRYQERQNLFDLEAIIDRQYYAGLIQHFRFLDAEQQKALQPLIGMLLDRINLVWLLRYRLNYSMDASHIYYLLAPTGSWLDKSVLMDLVQQDTLEDILEQLPQVWQKAVAESTEPQQVENAAERLLQRYTLDLFRQSGNGVVRLCCYLILRQYQLKQIGIILKGRQLDLDEKLIADAAGLTINLEEDLAAEEELTKVRTG